MEKKLKNIDKGVIGIWTQELVLWDHLIFYESLRLMGRICMNAPGTRGNSNYYSIKIYFLQIKPKPWFLTSQVVWCVGLTCVFSYWA